MKEHSPHVPSLENRGEDPVTPQMQAAELHDYLVEKIGHRWQLATWEARYTARIKKYGLEACKIAVDGFASQRWWMENKSADAPECIFRSDKSLERFLAAGMALPQHKPNEEELKKAAATRERREKIRAMLMRDPEVHQRFLRKIAPLRGIVSVPVWDEFIAPLLVVRKRNGVIELYHETMAPFVQEHYAERIGEKLGAKVKIVGDI
jgi:hypothetical protein